MAQVLSIVGEGGVDGIEYNYPLDAISNERRASKRMRWSLMPAHQFTTSEFEVYLKLAWRFGLVERSKYSERDLASGKDKSSYSPEDEIVRLTRAGWEFVDNNDRPILHRWAANIMENVPTIVTSVVGILLAQYLLRSI